MDSKGSTVRVSAGRTHHSRIDAVNRRLIGIELAATMLFRAAILLKIARQLLVSAFLQFGVIVGLDLHNASQNGIVFQVERSADSATAGRHASWGAISVWLTLCTILRSQPLE